MFNAYNAYITYNTYNTYKHCYLVGMGLVLEAQIPENVVDQMKEALVDQWNLLDYCSLGRVPVTKEAGSQKTFTHSINQTLTRRFEHRVMRPRSFHMLDETWASRRFSQCRDKLTYPAKGKWKTYYENATRHTKINHIIAITEIMNIIITTDITRRQTLSLWPRICVPLQRGLQAGRTCHGAPGHHWHDANSRWNRVDCRHICLP